jgi:hypothetical protein
MGIILPPPPIQTPTVDPSSGRLVPPLKIFPLVVKGNNSGGNFRQSSSSLRAEAAAMETDTQLAILNKNCSTLLDIALENLPINSTPASSLPRSTIAPHEPPPSSHQQEAPHLGTATTPHSLVPLQKKLLFSISRSVDDCADSNEVNCNQWSKILSVNRPILEFGSGDQPL